MAPAAVPDLSRACAALASLLVTGAVAAAGDPQRGAIVFQKCYACHSVVTGESVLSGPNLAGVVGRPVAGVPDFDYSPALLALAARGEGVWTEGRLDAFLSDPEAVAPGTAMSFIGLREPAARADVIAFLRNTR